MESSRLSGKKRRVIGIVEFAKGEINRLKETGRSATADNYTSAIRSFSNWLDGDICLNTISNITLIKYSAYLSDKRGLCRNSVSFHMRILKSLIYKAASRRICRVPEGLFDHVYTGIDSTRSRAVTRDVITALNSLPLQRPVLILARDTFMMSIYTRGMAFVDLAHLRWSDISDDLSELTYIRRKTSQRIRMAIEPCLRQLLRKYRGDSAGYVLPWLCGDTESADSAYRTYRTAINTYNRALGRLSEILAAADGAPVRLTSYVARHSWASAARRLNIPIAVISAGLGHASERTTEIYLARIESPVIDSANRLVLADFV